MLISAIITILLLYVAFHTTLNGEKLPYWTLICIAAIAMASWEAAIVMLCISGYTLYKGVKTGDVETIEWIQNLLDD